MRAAMRATPKPRRIVTIDNLKAMMSDSTAPHLVVQLHGTTINCYQSVKGGPIRWAVNSNFVDEVAMSHVLADLQGVCR